MELELPCDLRSPRPVAQLRDAQRKASRGFRSAAVPSASVCPRSYRSAPAKSPVAHQRGAALHVCRRIVRYAPDRLVEVGERVVVPTHRVEARCPGGEKRAWIGRSESERAVVAVQRLRVAPQRNQCVTAVVECGGIVRRDGERAVVGQMRAWAGRASPCSATPWASSATASPGRNEAARAKHSSACFEAFELGKREAALRQGRAVVRIARKHPVELADRFAEDAPAD